MPIDDDRPPVSDPAAAGLPEYADDDSSADVEAESGREADGPEPAALPPDREDGPLALDEFGTTAEEQSRGETLEDRLRREEPDVDPSSTGPRDAASADLDQPSDVGLGVGLDDPAVGGPVGRLVQPDGGAYDDTEADEVAFDAGLAGGGLSAEEAAVRQVPEDELDRPADEDVGETGPV